MSRIATDLLRIFAVTCIVFNHVSWPLFVSSASASGGMLAHISAIINQLGKPSVLFFLFLSGLAFSGKKEKLSVPAFYKSRLLRILPPFLLFSIIFSFYSEAPFHWLDPVGWIFAGTAHYHLYFVAVLLYLYILYPLLREIPYRPSYLLTLVGLGLLIHLINSLRYDAPLPVLMGFRLSDVGNLALEEPGSSNSPGSVIWLEYFAFAVPFFMAGLWMPEIVKRHSFLGTADSKATVAFKQTGESARFLTKPVTVDDTDASGVRPVHNDTKKELISIRRMTGLAGMAALVQNLQALIPLTWKRLRNVKWRTLIKPALWVIPVAAGFLLVLNDFVAGYQAGLHPDPAGRVWRISVALYAVALILFLLTLPQASSPLWIKKLSRASFLVYLLHPLWIEATRFLHPWYQTQVVIPLSWLTALALHELALSVPQLGLLLGEGDRMGLAGASDRPVAQKSEVSERTNRK